jgi:alpha(1,3/1,4) fucosyltransferase
MNLFPISDVNFSVFDFGKSHLNSCDFNIVDRVQDADVLIGKFFPSKNLLRGIKFRNRYGNKTPVLIWSCEPRDNLETGKNLIHRDLFYPDIHLMNMYVGGVCRTPVSYYGFHAQPTHYMTESELNGKQKLVVSVMVYIDVDTSFVFEDKNIDLKYPRQQITIYGHQKNLVDIYGNGWPSGISKGYSGHQPKWEDDKLEILKNYKFNICSENTAYPLYITEKIWHAVMGRCLPIYSSYNSSIYQTFPRGSFIDVCEFEGFVDLFAYIQAMPDSEYLERYNNCVEILNKFCQNYDLEAERQWIYDRLVDKLKLIGTSNK